MTKKAKSPIVREAEKKPRVNPGKSNSPSKTSVQTGRRKKIVVAVSVLVGVLLLGLIPGYTQFAVGVVRCGQLPVMSSDFAAGYTYRLPGDKGYSPSLLSDFKFCTGADAEAHGYHRID